MSDKPEQFAGGTLPQHVGSNSEVRPVDLISRVDSRKSALGSSVAGDPALPRVSPHGDSSVFGLIRRINCEGFRALGVAADGLSRFEGRRA